MKSRMTERDYILLNNALSWIWEHMVFETEDEYKEFKEDILKNYIGMTDEETEFFL